MGASGHQARPEGKNNLVLGAYPWLANNYAPPAVSLWYGSDRLVAHSYSSSGKEPNRNHCELKGGVTKPGSIRIRLILLSDAEDYRGDMSVLKQLIGADAIKGRRKYHQGAKPSLRGWSCWLATGKKASGALSRRIQPFDADRKVHPSDRKT